MSPSNPPIWRDDIDALAFQPAEHDGLCMVHRRAFRTLLRTTPSPRQCVEFFNAHHEAISFQLPVETQAEVHRLTDALSAVPEAEQCGWLKDRFGVSWQIVPRQLISLLGDPDRARARRAFEAMMEMKRIDIAALERARLAT